MKKSTRKGFIYFRYVFPIAAALVLLLLMLVPCYRYITADTGINGAISLSELISNSWDTAREYLFGNSQKNEVTSSFAKTLIAIIVTFIALFIVGLASAIYAAVSAFSYFKNGCRESKKRIMFITLTLNRAVLCVCHALMLPIFALPVILPYLYDNMFNYHVELDASPFDMLYVALAVYAAVVIVIAVSKNFEIVAEMNIYTKRRPEKNTLSVGAESESTEAEPEDAYERMATRARSEQTERIMRLLNKQDAEVKEKEEDK